MSGQLPSLEEAAQEALDSIEDRILQMNSVLSDVAHNRLAPQMSVAVLRQHAHSVKGLAAAVGVTILKVLAHRFEDFLEAVDDMDQRGAASCQVFVDRLGEALDGQLNASPEEIASFCRRLPAKGSFEVDDVVVNDVELMLVMAAGTATNYVTRELAECGYRIINVRSTVDALALAIQMRPDMIIVSNVMPELSGLDFTCAIKAMPATSTIPVALLTSEARDNPKLANLPDDVPILSKSAQFADDVADVFFRFGLL